MVNQTFVFKKLWSRTNETCSSKTSLNRFRSFPSLLSSLSFPFSLMLFFFSFFCAKLKTLFRFVDYNYLQGKPVSGIGWEKTANLFLLTLTFIAK